MKSVDALHQRVREPLLDGPLRQSWSSSTTAALPSASPFSAKVTQPLGRVGPAVEQHVLDELQQVLGDLLVDLEHAGVDDAHVEPGLDRVIEKRRVHGLAHDIVAAEAKTKCCETPPLTFAQRQVLL